jgi:hypothetical protein
LARRFVANAAVDIPHRLIPIILHEDSATGYLHI